MMCLKDLLLYMVLLPIPSASPLFVGLYWLAVILAIRPCGYCIALFTVINLSTSPSSPFVNLPLPQLSIDPLRPLTSPIPERSWLTWNEGRWWDPAIMGYREIANIYEAERNTTLNGTSATQDGAESDLPREEGRGQEDDRGKNIVGSIWDRIPWRRSAITSSSISISTPPPSASPSHPDPKDIIDSSAGQSTLPPGYIDLRWRGLGFVLDIGFSRSEQGLKWEIADTKRAIQYDKEARKVWQRGLAILEERRKGQTQPESENDEQNEEEQNEGTVNSAEKESVRWLDRVRLLGIW